MIIIEINGNMYSKHNPTIKDTCTSCVLTDDATCTRCVCTSSALFPDGAIYKRHYTASELANNIRNK